MKFDIVIGNPPYNDANQAKTKINGSRMASQGKILPDFIKLACDKIKQDGKILYVCPPSSEKHFRKNNKFINGISFIHNKNWGKRIAACWWIVSNTAPSNNNIILNKGISKILDYNPDKHRNNNNPDCIFLYNFSTVVRVGPTPFHYADGRYNLSSTKQNITNLKTLIEFIQPWMEKRINSWSSVNKKIKYEWLQTINKIITEQDIINHYGLTQEEIIEIKNN